MSAMAPLDFERSTHELARGAAARSAVAQALIARPGEWALVGTWTNGAALRQMAYSVRKGLSGWQMFGSAFDAETVTMLGEHRLYARYNGTAAEGRALMVGAGRAEVLAEAITAIEDHEQRRAARPGGGLGWESARDVLVRLLHAATETEGEQP